ncbi:hypothetical protein [Bosea sp. LjRoot237]|uniref:hypothetical protein n=1 Tax=Bosea sp. LjRoot237 TaxID=3342292 RepID=UPI003ECE357B
MTTFPDDIMRSAREAFIAYAGPCLDRASADHVLAGGADDAPLLRLAAFVTEAERRRCVSAVNAERVMDADENPSDADPTDIAYDMAIDHAIDAIKRPFL